MSEPAEVECYSGYTYAQEPRSFAWRGQRYVIDQVERSWHSPEGPGFLVRTEIGERFRLIYCLRSDRWLVDRC